MTTTNTRIELAPGEYIRPHFTSHLDGRATLALFIHGEEGDLTGVVDLVFPAGSARKHLQAIRDAVDAAEARLVAAKANSAEAVLDRAGVA